MPNFSLKRKDINFARLYYFVYMGGTGFISPFINLFYTSLQLNGKQIGTIAATSAVVGLFAAPIWVNEARKNPHARTILQAALALGALGYFLIGEQGSFLPILGIIFFHAMVVSGISPLSDSMAVSTAAADGSGYGSIRVMGSLGWIFAVPISGWLTQRFGFDAAFVSVASSWLAAAVIISSIKPEHFSNKQQHNQPQVSLHNAFERVIHDRTLLGFAIALIAIGFLNNGVTQFEYIFLSQLGATKQMISIAGILSAIVELPFMLWADKFIHRFGPYRLMLAALMLTCLQRAAVLLLPYIATVMAVRFIGGIAFSFYTISYIGIISNRTQPTETGTVLALFTVTLAGLVNIVAGPVMGAVFDAIGGRWLYGLATFGYAIGFLSLWVSRPKDQA